MISHSVLVTGGTGLLGKALVQSRPCNHELWVTHVRDIPAGLLPSPALQMELANRSEVMKVFERVRPEVVVHAAGVGSVDFAEKHQTQSYAVNVGGTFHLIEACLRHGSRLIYLSSNAVFDGEHAPYDEQSARRPINYYGRLKVQAENAVRASKLEHVIVRPILMYGWHYPHARENPVTWWLRLLGDCQPVKVVNDRYWQPLCVDDCAQAVWRMIIQRRTGIYHISGPERLSLYDFARQACQVFGLDDDLVEPVPSAYFPEIAPRPVDTSFVTERIRRDLGIHPKGPLAGLQHMRDTRVVAGELDEAY